MKTVVLFLEDQTDYHYYILEGDLRSLHNVFIGAGTDDLTEELEQERLCDLIYDCGILKNKESYHDAAVDAIRQGAYFIVAGSIP